MGLRDLILEPDHRTTGRTLRRSLSTTAATSASRCPANCDASSKYPSRELKEALFCKSLLYGNFVDLPVGPFLAELGSISSCWTDAR